MNFYREIKKYFKKSWKNIYLVPLILLTGVVAFFDGFAYKMFQSLENPSKVYQAIVEQYMQLFHGLIFIGVFGMAFVVYRYREFRDALAFLVFSFAVLWSGLWDLIYYQFGFTPELPESLTHLQGTPPGLTASLFNNGVVTPSFLVLNVFVFLFLGVVFAGYIRFGDRLDFLDDVPDF